MQSLHVKRQDLIEKVRANRDFHTKDFDRVLEILKMSVDETIPLDSRDIEAYVLDRWGTSKKPGREDHLKLYTYFGDRADKIKEAMFKTLTWSMGFAAALLGFIFAKLADFDSSVSSIISANTKLLPLPWLVMSIAAAGVVVCCYSWLILFESGKHIRKNWDNADKFLVQMPDLAEIVKGHFGEEGKFRKETLKDGTLEPVKEKEKWLQRQWARLEKVMPIWNQLFIVVALFMIAFFVLLVYGFALSRM